MENESGGAKGSYPTQCPYYVQGTCYTRDRENKDIVQFSTDSQLGEDVSQINRISIQSDKHYTKASTVCYGHI